MPARMLSQWNFTQLGGFLVHTLLLWQIFRRWAHEYKKKTWSQPQYIKMQPPILEWVAFLYLSIALHLVRLLLCSLTTPSTAVPSPFFPMLPLICDVSFQHKTHIDANPDRHGGILRRKENMLLAFSDICFGGNKTVTFSSTELLGCLPSQTNYSWNSRVPLGEKLIILHWNGG